MNNDINDRTEHDNNNRGESWSLLFVDDNKIASGIKSNEEMKETQETLNELYKWVENNGMEVNSGKTYCMRIGNLNPEGNSYIVPDGNKIEFVVSIKDLGIIIDKKGGFRSHLNKVISKCKRY